MIPYTEVEILNLKNEVPDKNIAIGVDVQLRLFEILHRACVLTHAEGFALKQSKYSGISGADTINKLQ